jgi:putative phosphoesterase
MKVAILGDVHGNAAALSAVLDAARREGVERLLVTGDLVGYYFSVAEVLRMLREWDMAIVRGNHEDMLCAVRRDPALLPGFAKKYGSGLEVALAELPAADLDWLCGLPHPASLELDGLRVLLCHGAPWANDAYVYPDAPDATLERCAVAGYDVVIMGHTHHPMQREIAGTIVINPGSVGQPRNREPGAQWALLDTATRSVSLRREAYDIAAVAAQARKRHPELAYLAEVLTRT